MIIKVETIELKTGAFLVRAEPSGGDFPSVIVREISGAWFTRANWGEDGYEPFTNPDEGIREAHSMIANRIGVDHFENVRRLNRQPQY